MHLSWKENAMCAWNQLVLFVAKGLNYKVKSQISFWGEMMVTLQTDRVNSVGNIFVGLPANEYPVTTVTRGPRSGSLFRGRSHRTSGLHRDHQTRCHGQEQHDEAWNDRCPRFCRTQIIYPTDPLETTERIICEWNGFIGTLKKEKGRRSKQRARAFDLYPRIGDDIGRSYPWIVSNESVSRICRAENESFTK